MSRIYGTPFAEVYFLYRAKLERKGQVPGAVDDAILWLTGLSDSELRAHVENGTTVQAMFSGLELNSLSERISGKICGVQIEGIQDPLMKKIRYLDKLVDELAKGKSLHQVVEKLEAKIL